MCYMTAYLSGGGDAVSSLVDKSIQVPYHRRCFAGTEGNDQHGDNPCSANQGLLAGIPAEGRRPIYRMA